MKGRFNMSVVSEELALQLKEAGLKWKPKEGDWFIFEVNETPTLVQFQSVYIRSQYVGSNAT